MRACGLVIGLVLAAGSAGAQPEVRRAEAVTPSATPEVRRAESVDPNTYQNPAWMDRVPVAPAQAVEQAVPVATPIPIATPIPMDPPPVPEATPVPVAPPERVPEPSTPAPRVPVPDSPAPRVTDQLEPASPPPVRPAVEPDADGSIRLAPSQGGETASQSLLAANGFYKRQAYDMAIYEYERFLIAEPNSPDRDGALFRLAESHRFLGNERAATEGYQRLLEEFREGEYVGSGAYRLGEIYYGDRNYGAAAVMFAKARENSAEDAIKLSAMFFEANALDQSDKKVEALAVFESIRKVEGENPYRDNAEFYIAETKARAGDKKGALEIYEKLGDDAVKAEMQAEATVKAAAIASELGRNVAARKLFEKALAKPAIGQWRGVAKLGAIRLAYDAGEFEGAAGLSEQEIEEFPPEAVPEALLISANANRQLGNAEAAVELYNRLLTEYPKSDAAGQARFQRLVSLDQTEGVDLLAEIEKFLAVSTDPQERARAFLLKAETLFKAGNYAEAATFYAKALESRLPDRLHEQALYKLAWSYGQSGDATSAVATFGKFLETYPDSTLVPSALAQRAVANQQAKAYDAAMRDFERLITEFPEAQERELALQQKALVLGQQEKFDEMAATFATLLKDYPKTKAAGQAEYWIGWAAFEKKDYAAALEHLDRARELDPKEFGDRSTVRMILVHFYAEDREAVAREAAEAGEGVVPSDVLVWLGTGFYDAGDYAKAEQFLAPMAERDPSVPVSPEVLINLAKARLAQRKFDAARVPVDRYIAQARDPVSRARGLQASAEIALGLKDLETADRLVEEALLLQPEGVYNAEGRLLSGDVQLARGDADAAARTYLTVAVLFDEPAVTPRALRKAAEAYRKAGNTLEAEKALKELAERYPDEAAEGTSARAD